MKPWIIDADAITLRSIEDDNSIFNIIVSNNQIREYLETGERDNKYFIVAPKGYGKTLLLKAKSKLYREKSGFSCIPKRSLCEKMRGCTVDFSIQEINTYKSYDIWEDIWNLCFHILIIQNHKDFNLPPELKNVIGRAKSLSNILTNILYDRKNLYKHKQLITKDLSPQVEEINSQFAIFIDNVDEAFERHTGNLFQEKRKKGKAENLSPRVWVNAQLGLMGAIKSICTSNKHIKIFASIRSEAFTINKASTSLQLKSYSTLLSYSNEDLLDIFEKNIALIDRKDLKSPWLVNSNKAMVSFLGTDHFQHPFAKDSFGNPRKEKGFDFILRHTLKRPRELMYMGDKINEIPPVQRNTSRVAELVNNSSKELFDQYKKEMIPFFREDVYKRICELLPSNVVSKKSYVEISEKIRKEFDFKDSFDSLHRIGLIGWTEIDKKDENIMRQRFLPAARYNFDLDKKLPNFSDYIVTHPMMDKDLWEIHGYFYNQDYIIGYDYPFIETVKLEKHHVHFGLSRDSLTLIIPELYTNTSLAIFKKPDEEWTGLFESDTLEIEINKADRLVFDVYHDKLSDAKKKKLINKWKSGRSDIVFYTNNKEVIKDFVKRVDSLSTSKNNGGYVHFLAFMKELDKAKPVNVYSFEYSKKEHKRLQDYFKNQQLYDVVVIPSVTERYFYNYKTDINIRIYKLIVECEDYLEFFVYRKNKLVESVFPQNTKVHWADSYMQFMYYLKRNKYLNDTVYYFRKILEYNPEHREIIDIKLISLFEKMQLFLFRNYFSDKGEDIVVKVNSSVNENEVNGVLKKYLKKSWKRFDALPSNYKEIEDYDKYRKKIQSLKILPNESILFKFIQTLNQHEKQYMLHLMALLAIYPSSKINSLFYNRKKIQNHKVFISYSSKDTAIANEIDADFKKLFSIKLKRDIRDLGYLESIKDFMDGVKDTDFVLMLISDNFLKSKYCMYEMIELKKDEKFQKKILPILINDSVQISRLEGRLQYYNYWEKEYQRISNLINSKGLNAPRDLKNEYNELDLVEKIQKSIDEFLIYISNLRLTYYKELKENGYLPILNILNSFDDLRS